MLKFGVLVDFRLFCKRLPFMPQKVAFRRVKGYLLQVKRQPFANGLIINGLLCGIGRPRRRLPAVAANSFAPKVAAVGFFSYICILLSKTGMQWNI